MTSIKHFLARYSALIWALLKPLGAWGVFAIAAVDASLFGMPLDPVVGGYVYANHARGWIYVLMASAGSAAGCIVLYAIGYLGGEVVLEKRMSKERFQKIRAAFERHETLALVVPSMMPPPFPFKAFVLGAAVFEMNFWHFLGAIFLGRVIRFSVLALLVLLVGPQIVGWTAHLLHAHLHATLAGTVAVVLAIVLFQRMRGRKQRPLAAQRS